MVDTPTTPTNGNRITIAILNANILYLTKEVEALRADVCAKLADHEARIRVAEQWGNTSQERWRTHENDHKALNAKNWAADVIGSIAAAITGIMVSKP